MSNRVKKNEYKSATYSSGDVAVKLYCNLLRDFRISEGNDFFAGAELALLKDIKEFRARPERELGVISVGRFKRTKQMESLLKKFRFEQDAFTDDELGQLTREKFLDDQVRLHTPLPMKTTGRLVLQRARIIARRLLGDLPREEVIENVRFGKKSSIGCPLSHAYIDVKLSDVRAMTGTRDTAEFFLNQVLPGDQVLQRILKSYDFDSIKESNLSYTHLNLVEVPKTWKTYRLITPLTLLGLFYSYGIGRVVQSRLQDAGLDISKLQEIHRKLVKWLSVSCKLATADLSGASDSITSELLNRILPRPWYVALKKTFVRQLNIDGVTFSTASVLPMGNGATFPVETLVFYCLLKAVAELSSCKGKISVYGDDLIYPSRMHKYVAAVFPQLHLKLNLDKTFVQFPFRESCGSDFYRGQDVRPYFLKGDSANLTRTRYEAFLYKVYNGLTARWEPLEIRQTLTWILAELNMVSHSIKRVPPSYPDSSGIKVESCTTKPFDYHLLNFSPILMQFRNGSRWFQFDFLTETPKQRVVKLVEPYYWLAMQGVTDEVADEYSGSKQRIAGQYTAQQNAKFLLKHGKIPRAKSAKSSLSWKGVAFELKTIFKKGRRVKKKVWTEFVATTAARNGAAVSVATNKADSISDWI